VAAKYAEVGYPNVKVLDGGVQGWKRAGLPLDDL